MKIKHRYTFHYENENNDIVKFLRNNNISFDIASGIPLVTIEMFEHNSLWTELDKIMKTNNVPSLVDKIFTKNEIEESKWLRIRTKKRALYPQPEDDFGYESITYDNRNNCNLCGSGVIQKDVFQLSKSPKWGKRNLLMLNWVHDEIFINRNVNESLNKSDLRGFKIEKVKNYKTKQYFSDVFQIRITDTLDKGMIFDEDDIKIENYCSKCGLIKRIISGKYVTKYNSEVFKNKRNDIYKTNEAFGDGKEYFKSIIISNQMYKFLKDNGFVKDLYIEPVEII